MSSETTGTRGIHLKPQKEAPEASFQRPASDIDVRSRQLRLWRAAAPQAQVAARAPDGAGEEYLQTRARDARPTILFDSGHYLSQLPAFVRETIDPLDHYLRIGWSLGLSPHLAFDSAFLAEQLGVARWTEPPLLAYFEKSPEVSAHPLFDVEEYARHVEFDDTAYARLFEMFLGSWGSARASFSGLFSLRFYEMAEPAVRFGRLNPLMHYLSTEPARRRDANPMIHNIWYDRHYPARPGQPHDPLVRYAQIGLRDGHLPNPFAPAELKLVSAEAYVPRDLLRAYVNASAADGLLGQGRRSDSVAELSDPRPFRAVDSLSIRDQRDDRVVALPVS